MRCRADRRRRTQNKIKQRLRFYEDLGPQMGTMYQRHRTKIEQVSGGYMSTGNIRHFVSVHRKYHENKALEKESSRRDIIEQLMEVY